ncbi:uncharacterized protein KIAA1143 homolog [Spodoptera litura]|uniref:Uncharacterized protein KIAA1143 homolog n=1 Tax=Spodoptera litura TaxID=69820 RepID=A0A9J7DPM0_SPOLT|nr:uncharacterized protein KIAA1143 homolog [Spodoptera litura]
MNRKRNVSFIKPEDPEFLKVLKRQAGYDDKNHKFDDLMNAEGDFAEDDDSEQPQVVVLKEGDLTAEEAEAEKLRIDKLESETKADLNQRVLFKAKAKPTADTASSKRKQDNKRKESKGKKSRPVLSFNDEEEEDEDNET